MNARNTLAALLLGSAVVLASASCSSAADSTDTTASPETSVSATAAPSACPVAYSGPNPSRADVEADIGALAADQNAVNAQYRDALGDIPLAPTTASLSDQQVAILDAAPAGALEKLSSTFCTDQSLSGGMTQRIEAAIAANVPDSTPQASEIRAAIVAVSESHPISLLLSTTFDVCALGGAPGSEITRETNPLATDRGAITIVDTFCPDQASLFDPVS